MTDAHARRGPESPRVRSKPHERLTSYDVKCHGCGTTFTATRPDAHYCSNPCRSAPNATAPRRTPRGLSRQRR
jgi:rRNA maturation endonuclease Nob1